MADCLPEDIRVWDTSDYVVPAQGTAIVAMGSRPPLHWYECRERRLLSHLQLCPNTQPVAERTRLVGLVPVTPVVTRYDPVLQGGGHQRLYRGFNTHLPMRVSPGWRDGRMEASVS